MSSSHMSHNYDPDFIAMSWSWHFNIICHMTYDLRQYWKLQLIYCFQLHFQLWNGNVNWNQIFSKLCLTELWWGEGFTLIEWWKFPMEKKMKLPERIIHFNIVIGSVQVTSIAAQVQGTYHLQSKRFAPP